MPPALVSIGKCTFTLCANYNNVTEDIFANNNSNVDSLNRNVDSLEGNIDSSRIAKMDEYTNFSIAAKSLLMKKRLRQSEMESLICEIASEWRTIQELSQILGKDKSYLRNHILPQLVSRGVLEREYPVIPNHPNQRYRTNKRLFGNKSID